MLFKKRGGGLLLPTSSSPSMTNVRSPPGQGSQFSSKLQPSFQVREVLSLLSHDPRVRKSFPLAMRLERRRVPKFKTARQLHRSGHRRRNVSARVAFVFHRRRRQSSSRMTMVANMTSNPILWR